MTGIAGEDGMGQQDAAGSQGALSARLLAVLGRLPPAEARLLVEFAEFLVIRQAQTPVTIPVTIPVTAEDGTGALADSLATTGVPTRESARLTRKDIPRPAQESVVKAMKRLRETYAGMNHRSLLDAATTLMTQHVMMGRAAGEVIDELERLFREEFERLGRGAG